MVHWIIRTMVLLFVAAVSVTGCKYPEKPVLRGTGKLAVQIDSDKLIIPEYHNPIEMWRKRHMQSILRKEFTEQECMSCHKVETSCNNCHEYVGAPAIIDYSPRGFLPGEDRTRLAVNDTKPKE